MAQKSFVRKKVKSLTLGEKLRQLREDRRLRVYDLSRKINVKDAYIDALEKGRYDLLPTKVYTKGFVRSYARYFGVPEELLLGLFEREYSVFHNINLTEEEETVSKLPKVPLFVLTPRLIIAFFGIIALVAIGVYLYFGVDNFISSPWLVIDTPTHNSVIDGNTVAVQGKTRSNSRVFINGQQVFVDMDGYFTDDVVLSVGANVIRVNSINKFNRETVQEITVEARYEVQKPVVEEKKEKLYIQARREAVTLTVRIDDDEPFDDVIEPDQTREYHAHEKMSISTTNGKNTYYSADGESYESIGQKDVAVTDWVYPHPIEEESANDVDVEVKEEPQKKVTKKKNEKS